MATPTHHRQVRVEIKLPAMNIRDKETARGECVSEA